MCQSPSCPLHTYAIVSEQQILAQERARDRWRCRTIAKPEISHPGSSPVPVSLLATKSSPLLVAGVLLTTRSALAVEAVC